MKNFKVYSTNGNLIQHSKPTVTVETAVEMQDKENYQLQ